MKPEMRKLPLYLFAAATALAGATTAVSAQTAPPAKIAFVNSERLFQEAPGAAEARTTIQREADKYRAELALLEDSIKNMYTEYAQKQVMLSPDAKKKSEDAINAKQRVFEQRSTQYEQQMTKRQEDLVKPIMDRINKALEDMRKEGGYAFILDSARGSIIAADTTLDLTTQVLAKLRTSGATAGAPKAPGSK